MAKVARVHGEHDPRLAEVERLVVAAGDGTEESAGALGRIRDLTAGYAVPEWACVSYRRLFDELRTLDPGA